MSPKTSAQYDQSAYEADWFNFGNWISKDDLTSEDLLEYNFFAGSHSFGEDAMMRISTIDVTECPSNFF